MTTPQQQAYIEALRVLPADLEALVASLSDEQLDSREAPNEWSIRQIVHHIVDAHMNGMIRIKLALTEDKPTIKYYDQDKWAELADYTLPIESSLLMIKGLHVRFVALLTSLTDAQWQLPVIYPQVGDKVVEDVAQIYAEHGAEHIEQIKCTLAEGLRK